MNTFSIRVIVFACFALTWWDPTSSLIAQSSRSHGRNSPEMKNTLESLIGNTGSSVCEISSDGSTVALGTVVSEDGLVVTKHSEIQSATSIQCDFGGDEKFDAEIAAVQSDYDLALLRVKTTGLIPVDLGADGIRIRSGALVVSPDTNGKAISMGVVSVEPRRFRMRQSRRPPRGYLGVECRPVEDGDGLEIRSVSRGSAASRAGLKRSDIILQFESDEVSSVEQLIEKLSGFKPDDEVSLLVHREEEPMTITARLSKAPARNPYDQWGGGPFSEKRFGFPGVIPHDSVIRPGQCGGPLLNSDGEVIGINIARALRVATYAVPVARVAEFVESNHDAGQRNGSDE